jgi:hypothetical protein
MLVKVKGKLQFAVSLLGRFFAAILAFYLHHNTKNQYASFLTYWFFGKMEK